MSDGTDDFLACYRTLQLRWSWFALCQKETLGPYFKLNCHRPSGIGSVAGLEHGPRHWAEELSAREPAGCEL